MTESEVERRLGKTLTAGEDADGCDVWECQLCFPGRAGVRA
jgi:hypothetical protein